jgi:DNA polymerase-3 subunit epsilon
VKARQLGTPMVDERTFAELLKAVQPASGVHG